VVKRPTSCATLGAPIAIRDPARWWYWWYKSSVDFRKTLLLSQELETLLLCNTIPQTGLGLAFGSIRVWPVTSSHTLGITKLWTPYEDRHDDKTSQSFWKAANHVFEAEDLSIILTTKETLKVGLDLMGGSKHYFVSSHSPMLVLAWVLYDFNGVMALLKRLTLQAVAAARILWNLPGWGPFIASWISFSYSGFSVACCMRRPWWAGGMLNETILDALIGINQIGKAWCWSAPNWVMRAECTRSSSWSTDF